MKRLATSLLLVVWVLLWAGPPARADGYLGMSLPGDFRIFSADSWWNIPIPEDAKVNPLSRIMMRKMDEVLEKLDMPRKLVVAVDQWTPPLHIVDAGKTPKRNVINTGLCLHSSIDPDRNNLVDGVPIPDEAWADMSSDGSMIILDIKNRIIWEFWRANRRPDGHWEAGAFFRWDLDGLGYPTEIFTDDCLWGVGIRGSGVSVLGGLVRPEELETGVINHAIALASPINRKKISADVPWEYEFCHPIASETDAGGEGDTGGIGPAFIPEGARLQLNPDLDLDALGLSKNARIIARALQKYGGFILDNSEAFHMYMQNIGAEGRDIYAGVDDLGNIPLDEFRVLSCDMAQCMGKKGSCVLVQMD